MRLPVVRALAIDAVATGSLIHNTTATSNVSLTQEGLVNTTIHPSRGGNATCISGFINLTANTTSNTRFALMQPSDQVGLTDIFTKLVLTNGSPFLGDIIAGSQSAGGNFSIGATICVPVNGPAPQQLHVLTHGIGFDRYYWDFASGYSYVDVAAQAGHASLFYDRLGTGVSPKPDPLDIVQISLEIEVLNVIVKRLQSGGLAGLKPTSLVGIGHSYGSQITEGLTARSPTAFNATVLTAVSTDLQGMPAFEAGNQWTIAAQNNPYRFTGLPNGYVVPQSALAIQTSFLRAPNFDPSILSLSDATKATSALGQLLTAAFPSPVASNYTRPVALINGENDLAFCFANCTYPMDITKTSLQHLYPNSNRTVAYNVPGTGHGINLHYSAHGVFEWIQTFLAQHT